MVEGHIIEYEAETDRLFYAFSHYNSVSFYERSFFYHKYLNPLFVSYFFMLMYFFNLSLIFVSYISIRFCKI